MAVPKHKTSKARRDKRRSSVWKLDIPGMTKCPKCGEYTLSHRVCKELMPARRSLQSKRTETPTECDFARIGPPLKCGGLYFRNAENQGERRNGKWYL